MCDTKEIFKTDGKRRVAISDEDYVFGGIDIKVCRNGWQTTVVTIDKEMLSWLKDVITEYLEHSSEKTDV